MRIIFYFFIAINSCLVAQNYNLSQVEIDLTQYKKSVYFCFDKETYSPMFAKNDLEIFKTHIEENLKYNFIFHLENHNSSWQELARKQHGIQYSMVCKLRMSFRGLQSAVILYYQDPIRDMQWEKVFAVNFETKEEKDWIKRVSYSLSEKVKDSFRNDKDKKIQALEQTLQEVFYENSAQQSKIEQLETEIYAMRHTIQKLEQRIDGMVPAIGKWFPSRGVKVRKLDVIKLNVRLDVEDYNTNNSYFGRKIDNSGIIIRKSGYYQINAMAKINSFTKLYLSKNNAVLAIDSVRSNNESVEYLRINYTGYFHNNDVIQLQILGSILIAYTSGSNSISLSIKKIIADNDNQ